MVIDREADGGPTATWLSGWGYPSSVDWRTSTTTVTDKLMEKVVGKPYRGKLDVRFDERGWETESW
jgi:hypothetical protein